MRKIIVGFGVFLGLAGLIFLVQSGFINWQPLTIIVTALLAPFRAIMSLFGNEDSIREEHKERRAAEHAYQAQLEDRLRQREIRVANLYDGIDKLEDRIAVLQEEKDAIATTISAMSTEERRQQGRDLLGG